MESAICALEKVGGGDFQESVYIDARFVGSVAPVVSMPVRQPTPIGCGMPGEL